MSHYTGSVPATERPHDWRELARCARPEYAEVRDELFFPAPNDLQAVERAQRICYVCPVRLECGQTALREREQWGVWGGMSENQRLSLLKRRGWKPTTPQQQAKPRPKKRQPAKCGTRAGYKRHLREKTEICAPCRKANTDADNRLRRTGTSKAAR